MKALSIILPLLAIIGIVGAALWNTENSRKQSAAAEQRRLEALDAAYAENALESRRRQAKRHLTIKSGVRESEVDRMTDDELFARYQAALIREDARREARR